MKLFRFISLFLFVGFGLTMHAQDTFYVKKKPPQHTVTQKERVAIDSSDNDSIVSYTLQYKKRNSNLWVVRHEKGPRINVPHNSEYEGRVLITDIIAVDKNGVKYRKPDKYYSGGIWADVPRK